MIFTSKYLLRKLLPLILYLFGQVVGIYVLIDKPDNYIETTRLPDGEVLTKVHFNNVTALQTTVAGYTLQQVISVLIVF